MEEQEMLRTLIVLSLILAPITSTHASSPVMATQENLPPQLTGIKVTGGYHVNLFIVLKGHLEFSGTGSQAPHLTTMWVNGFPTVAGLDGNFSLLFPIASLYNPIGEKGTVVAVKAFQPGHNVEAMVEFDLSDINQMAGVELTPESLRAIQEAAR